MISYLHFKPVTHMQQIRTAVDDPEFHHTVPIHKLQNKMAMPHLYVTIQNISN